MSLILFVVCENDGVKGLQPRNMTPGHDFVQVKLNFCVCGLARHSLKKKGTRNLNPFYLFIVYFWMTPIRSFETATSMNTFHRYYTLTVLKALSTFPLLTASCESKILFTRSRFVLFL